jgi:predicted transcriptional regulator
MTTITITLPDEVAAQIEAQHISQQQLDAFVVTAVKAWLNRHQAGQHAQHNMNERPWSEAFQDSAVDFVDQLIDENKALFEELARL